MNSRLVRYNEVRTAAVLITLLAALSSTIQGGITMPENDSSTPKPYGVVYLIRNTLNGKVYVGQTRNGLSGRWSDHVYSAGHGSKQRIHQAIRKHGKGSFTIEQIGVGDSDSDLNAAETAAIKHYDSCAYSRGYNMAPEAFGVSEDTREKLRTNFSGSNNPMFGKPGTRLGAKWSDEQRLQHATTLARLKSEGVSFGGPKWTEQRRAKMSGRFSGEGNPFFGKQHSEESRRKNSAAKRGKPSKMSPEERMRLSELHSGVNNPMFGKRLTAEALQKMRDRWAEFRAMGRKMNLSEEAREIRRQQAAAMRVKKTNSSRERRASS